MIVKRFFLLHSSCAMCTHTGFIDILMKETIRLTSLVICLASIYLMRNVTIHREDEKTNAVERSIDLTNYGQVLGVRLGRTPSQYHPEKNMA